MSDTVTRKPRRNRAFWIEHIQRCQRSGLSKAAYCKQHNLKASSFYNWSSKATAAAPTETQTQPLQSLEPASIRLQPVKLSHTDSLSSQFIHVQRAATDIALPSDLTPEQIHRWLSAIHQLHV